MKTRPWRPPQSDDDRPQGDPSGHQVRRPMEEPGQGARHAVMMKTHPTVAAPVARGPASHPTGYWEEDCVDRPTHR